MTAKLKIENGAGKPMRREKRRIARFLSSSRVSIRSSHGDSGKAELGDVSVFGCSLSTGAEWLRIGMFVTIGLSNDWTIQAIVRWTRDNRAGVEFLRPISEEDALEMSKD